MSSTGSRSPWSLAPRRSSPWPRRLRPDPNPVRSVARRGHLGRRTTARGAAVACSRPRRGTGSDEEPARATEPSPAPRGQRVPAVPAVAVRRAPPGDLVEPARRRHRAAAVGAERHGEQRVRPHGPRPPPRGDRRPPRRSGPGGRAPDRGRRPAPQGRGRRRGRGLGHHRHPPAAVGGGGRRRSFTRRPRPRRDDQRGRVRPRPAVRGRVGQRGGDRDRGEGAGVRRPRPGRDRDADRRRLRGLLDGRPGRTLRRSPVDLGVAPRPRDASCGARRGRRPGAVGAANTRSSPRRRSRRRVLRCTSRRSHPAPTAEDPS